MFTKILNNTHKTCSHFSPEPYNYFVKFCQNVHCSVCYLLLFCDVNCASYLAPNTGPIKVYCICMRKNFRTITRLVDY